MTYTEADTLKFLQQATPEQLDKILEYLRINQPENYKKAVAFLQANRGFILEAKGYEEWLTTLGPHTFTGSFAPFHRDLWEWYWPATLKQKSGQPLNLEDITYLAIWARGLGKSSSAEWLAIAEGCLIGKGFVLYVSGTQEQAEAHVEAIRDRLETEEVLKQLYPGMKKPRGKGGYTGEHKQYGWRQDYLMTDNGWAIRPVGLDKAIRGWKRGDTRVTLIILDDIDDDDDSPEVILKKERRIAKKILPMGTARTKVVFAQNLIHSNSVLNRMHTRQNNMLAVRKGDKAIPAFTELETELRQTPTGPRNVITKAIPTWKDFDMAEAQSFLDRSDLMAFLAEYQHDFKGEQNERVLPEYDDRVLRTNLITWSQFEALYRQRRIPSDWMCDVGLDLGYTAGHRSAWTFLSKAPEGVALAGSIFRYRGCVFEGVTVGTMSAAVKDRIWPNENLMREFMSHEKLGEQLVLNREHGWHFHPCDSGKAAGIAQWRHFLKADKTKPHPFHRDEKQSDGLWKIGCPMWFDVVDDDQFITPRDDRGLKAHRDQAYQWKMRPVEETKSGMTVEQPMKANEDSCFVAGTRIETARGSLPIEKVRIGDYIWTRKGLRRCLASGMTSESAPVVMVEFSNGKSVMCTPNHPIWIENEGFLPCDTVRMGGIIQTWQSTKLSSIAGCAFTAIQNLLSQVRETIFSLTNRTLSEVLSRYTLRFGKRLTGMYHQTPKYITETATRSTMTFPTWNAFPRMSTSASTLATSPRIASVTYANDWTTTGISHLSGIEAQKGESGIDRTAGVVHLSGHGWTYDVSIAEYLFNQSPRLPGFVPPAASNGNATDVPTPLKRGLARRVLHFLLSLSAHAVSTARITVKTKSTIKTKLPVFNLSVEGEQEYFANDVLVHNCDSTRMLTVGFGPVISKMTQQARVQAIIPAGYHRSELAERTDIDPTTKHLTAEMAEWFANRQIKKPVQRDWFGQPLR